MKIPDSDEDVSDLSEDSDDEQEKSVPLPSKAKGSQKKSLPVATEESDDDEVSFSRVPTGSGNSGKCQGIKKVSGKSGKCQGKWVFFPGCQGKMTWRPNLPKAFFAEGFHRAI